MCEETAAADDNSGIPPDGANSSSGAPGDASHLREQVNARLTARIPISIERRVALGQHLARALRESLADGHAISVAVLYLIKAGQVGLALDRTNVYLRCGMSFPASAGAIDPASTLASAISHFSPARARKRLNMVLDHAGYQLDHTFTLERVAEDPVAELLRSHPCAPMAELAYDRWPEATDWLVPINIQPVVDRLVAQPDCAAVQITLERVVGVAMGGSSRLRLSVVAVGAAVHMDTLRLLARELRGRGSLRGEPLNAASVAPMLKVAQGRTAAEYARISQNLSGPSAEPWAETPHMGDITLTSGAAGLLLALPFALFPER